MGKKIIEIFTGKKYLSVTWQVNNFCNFKCSYCNPGNWSGTEKNDSNLKLYLYNLESIINTYKKNGYENFKFFFSGGEPTAWKNFIPICEWLRNEIPDCTIAVNTNLSRPLAWWEKHYHLFDDIVASFHVEFSNKKTYENNSLFLCNKVNYLASKMLMHEERFWEVVEFGEHLKTVLPNYFIEWTPLFDEMTINAGPWQYKDPEKAKFLETHTYDFKQSVDKPSKENNCVSYIRYEDKTVTHVNSTDVIINRQNFFKNWECDVGDSIFINPSGAISLASCGQGGYVGNIIKNVGSIGPKKIICGKEHCHCGTDIIIPKILKQV
jgi:organic radical activating enzyme